MHDSVAPIEASNAESILIFGSLVLNFATGRVHANGLKINLGPTEFRMLHFFMGHPERVYSRTELLSQVWSKEVVVGERTVDVHIRRLRAAMEPAQTSHLIQTVRSRGYRFLLHTCNWLQ